MKIDRIISINNVNQQSSNNKSFNGWLTYTNAQGLKKMLNTDTIQNIESKKITYIIKDKKFTGNYIFDAVQILLKGDNRVCNRSKGKINGTINTGFWEKTVGVKYTTGDRDGWGHNKHSQSYNEGLTNGKSYSKIDLDVDGYSESTTLDKFDTIIINFKDFAKIFKEALQTGFGEITSKKLPESEKMRFQFFANAHKYLPTETKCYQERKWMGNSAGFMMCNSYEIVNLPSIDEIKKGMSHFDKSLKKEYGKYIDISYDNDCPAENDDYYKAFEIITK